MAKTKERDPYLMPPDETVFERVRQIYQDSAERRKVHDETRAVVKQDFKIEIPTAMEKIATVIKSATGPGVQGRLTGYFTVSPRIEVIPDESAGASGQTKATKIERWLNAALKQMARDAGADPWMIGVTDVVTLGLAGFQIAWDSSAWSGMPDRYEPTDDDDVYTQQEKIRESRKEIDEWKQREGRMPIVLRHVSGYSVYYIRDRNGLAEVFDIEWQEARSVVSRYPDSEFAKKWRSESPESRTSLRSVPVCHYANRKYCAVMLIPGVESNLESTYPQTEEPEQEFLQKPYPHLIRDDVPYSIVPGMYTGEREIGHDVVGPLYHVRHLIVQRDTLLTYKATSQRQKVFLNYVMKHSEYPDIDEQTGEQKEYKIHEGEIWHMRTEDDVQALQNAGDPIFDDVIQALTDAIERMTIPGPGFGVPQGINSGYMANTLQVAGTLHFEPVEEHLREGLERIGYLMLKLVQASGQTVWVRNHGDTGYLGLNPDDIGKYLPELQATVREKPPMDYPANIQTATQALQSGVWDIFTAREFAAPSNGLGPEEIESRMQAHQIVTSQQAQKMMLDQFMAQIAEKLAERNRKQSAVTADEIMALPPAARQAALQAALQYIAQGGSFPPEVFNALGSDAQMGMSGMPGPLPGGEMAGAPPVGGAPNMNMPMGPGTMPAPPPTSGLAMGQAPQVGGRRAGGARQPTGPQQQGGL